MQHDTTPTRNINILVMFVGLMNLIYCVPLRSVVRLPKDILDFCLLLYMRVIQNIMTSKFYATVSAKHGIFEYKVRQNVFYYVL